MNCRVLMKACSFKLRQNKNTVTDFSAILAFQEKGANKDFKLRRYNGKHEHTNKLENRKFFDFHIHYATQRNAIRMPVARKKVMPRKQTDIQTSKAL